MSTQTPEQKKSAKAAYDKKRRAGKGEALTTKAERAATIAQRVEVRATTTTDLKATAGTHGRPAAAAVKESKVRQPTVATVARELIAAGSTDEQVFAQLVKQFQVTEAKKSYPSWYRSQMVRKGGITKAFADKHRHNAKV